MNIVFPYNKNIITKIKRSFLDWDYNPADGWTASDCKRNQRWYDYLFNGVDQFTRVKENLPNSPRFESLWNHQKEIYNHCLAKQVIIAGEPRIGKTLPVLTLAEQLFALGKIKSLWWIAPVKSLEGIKLEIAKWKMKFPESHETHETHETHGVFLFSYDKFRKISVLPPPDFLVFDECHKLKDPKTLTTKAALDIAERMDDSQQYRILLSGTPAPHSPADWWALTEIAFPGWYAEATKNQFLLRLGEKDLNFHFIKINSWHLDKVAALTKANAGLVLVKFKKDCLILPPSETVLVKLKPNKLQMKVAEMLKKQATKAIVLLNKLRQISDGFLYQEIYNENTGSTDSKIDWIGSPKYDQLRIDLADLAELNPPRVVIYCAFTETVDQVTKVTNELGWNVLRVDGRGWKIFTSPKNTLPSKEKGYTSQDLLKEMDASCCELTCPIAVVAQADSASTGLEFSAAPTMIYFSNSDNGASKMQSKERNMSGNSKNSVEYREYICLKSDERIIERLENKQTLQSMTLTELLEEEDK